VLSVAETERHRLVYHHVTGIRRGMFPELLGILYEIKVSRGDYVLLSIHPCVLLVAWFQRFNFRGLVLTIEFSWPSISD